MKKKAPKKKAAAKPKKKAAPLKPLTAKQRRESEATFRRFKALKAKKARNAKASAARLKAYWAGLSKEAAKRKRSAASKLGHKRRRARAAAIRAAAELTQTAEHASANSVSTTHETPFDAPLPDVLERLATLARGFLPVPVAYNFRFLYKSATDDGSQWVSTGLTQNLDRAIYEAESIVAEFENTFQYGRAMEPVRAAITIWTFLKGAR